MRVVKNNVISNYLEYLILINSTSILPIPIPLQDGCTTTLAILRFFSISLPTAAVTSHPILCKVIRSKPGNWLGWHSHQHDPVIKQYNKPEQCIIHIPVIQHEDVAFLVTEDMPSNRSDFQSLEYYKNDTKSYVGSFVPGKAYFFNGYYPHGFKNYSNYDRIDIVLYSDTTENPLIEETIERSIAKYTGPLIGTQYV